MKTSRLFVALLALLSVLSCQKEERQTPVDPGKEGGTLVTCTFAANDAASKTTLEGKTPKWAANDEIMLYDGSSNIQTLTLATSGTASSSTGIIDSTDAKKFTFVKPGGWTNVYAIYPFSACASDFGTSHKINFAGQDGTFAKANICAAAESSGTMSFQNVAAIFKFPSKPSTVTGLEIRLAGLANDYTVSFSGTTPSLESASASNSRSYSIGTGTGEIYVAVPGGETIAENTAFIYRSSSSNILGSYLIKTATKTVTNNIYTLPAIEANGMLPGIFTVKAASNGTDTTVRFSVGNLHCKRTSSESSDWTWGFYANQYDYNSLNPSEKDTLRTPKASDTEIDLFCWGYDASGSLNPVEEIHRTTFTDWGTIGTLPAVSGRKWETLSVYHWEKLLYWRAGVSVGEVNNARYAEVKVKGVGGLLLFPDIFTWPDGITTGKPTTFNSASSDWNNVNYTVQEFLLLESAGCAFLPAAGIRYKDSYNWNRYGNYWTSSPHTPDGAYGLFFYPLLIDYAHIESSCYGYSVRLVSAVTDSN